MATWFTRPPLEQGSRTDGVVLVPRAHPLRGPTHWIFVVHAHEVHVHPLFMDLPPEDRLTLIQVTDQAHVRYRQQPVLVSKEQKINLSVEGTTDVSRAVMTVFAELVRDGSPEQVVVWLLEDAPSSGLVQPQTLHQLVSLVAEHFPATMVWTGGLSDDPLLFTTLRALTLPFPLSWTVQSATFSRLQEEWERFLHLVQVSHVIPVGPRWECVMNDTFNAFYALERPQNVPIHHEMVCGPLVTLKKIQRQLDYYDVHPKLMPKSIQGAQIRLHTVSDESFRDAYLASQPPLLTWWHQQAKHTCQQLDALATQLASGEGEVTPEQTDFSSLRASTITSTQT